MLTMTFWWYLIAGVAGAVVGLLVAVASVRVSKGAGIGGGLVVGIVVALVVQAFGQTYALPGTPAPEQANSGVESTPEAAPEPTQSASVTSTPPDQLPTAEPTNTAEAPVGQDEPTEADSAEPTADENPEHRYFLGDVRRIRTEKEGRAGGCTGGCTGFRAGSGRIGGTVFSQSFLMGVAADGRRSVAAWNSVRQCSSLEATLGLDDASTSAEVTFTISRDGGSAEWLATTSLAQTEPIYVSLDGVAQFELAAYVSGAKAENDVRVVLGDAVMICRSGSIED